MILKSRITSCQVLNRELPPTGWLRTGREALLGEWAYELAIDKLRHDRQTLPGNLAAGSDPGVGVGVTPKATIGGFWPSARRLAAVLGLGVVVAACGGSAHSTQTTLSAPPVPASVPPRPSRVR